jgi:hypothetical protein
VDAPVSKKNQRYKLTPLYAENCFVLKNAKKHTPINKKSVSAVMGSSIRKPPIYMVGF